MEDLFLSLIRSTSHIVEVVSNLTGITPYIINCLLLVASAIIVLQLIGWLSFRKQTHGIRCKKGQQRIHLKQALKAIKQIKKMPEKEALSYLSNLNGFTFELVVYIALIKAISRKSKVKKKAPIQLTGDRGLDGYFSDKHTLYLIQSKSYKLSSHIRLSDIEDFCNRIKRISSAKGKKKSIMSRHKSNDAIGFFVSTGILSSRAKERLASDGIVSINNSDVATLITKEEF